MTNMVVDELTETFKELVRVRREFAAYVERVARGEDDKIYTIRAYRIATQLPLKEAKDIICREYEKRPKPVESLPINDNDARIQRLEDSVYYLTQRIERIENK